MNRQVILGCTRFYTSLSYTYKALNHFTHLMARFTEMVHGVRSSSLGILFKCKSVSSFVRLFWHHIWRRSTGRGVWQERRCLFLSNSQKLKYSYRVIGKGDNRLASTLQQSPGPNGWRRFQTSHRPCCERARCVYVCTHCARVLRLVSFP